MCEEMKTRKSKCRKIRKSKRLVTTVQNTWQGLNIILLFVHRNVCCEGHIYQFIADMALNVPVATKRGRHNRELPFWELGARADPAYN